MANNEKSYEQRAKDAGFTLVPDTPLGVQMFSAAVEPVSARLSDSPPPPCPPLSAPAKKP